MKNLSLFLLISILLTNFCIAKIKQELLVGGFGVIWSIIEIKENNFIFTTRNGQFFIFDLKKSKTKEIKSDLKVFNEGQAGLLDLKAHPDFNKNKLLYFTYVPDNKSEESSVCLGRAKLNLKALKLSKIQKLFCAESIKNDLNYGSRITWDEKKHIYMSIGDRFDSMELAQKLTHYLGKILKLDENGKASKDNPFYGEKNSKWEIWSYGHRNPQGLFYNIQTKQLWSVEHGPKGGDELNLIIRGQNYGWPIATSGKNYDGTNIAKMNTMEKLEPPIYEYTPSIAPSSVIIYSAKAHKELTGKILISALAGKQISILSINGTKVIEEEKILLHLNERIRCLLQTIDGEILFTTDSGKIYKIL